MRVKTFEAASMQEAIAAIKQEMGEDASILSTRTRRPAKHGGGAVIEVTAAVDDSGAQQGPPHKKERPKPGAAGPGLPERPKPGWAGPNPPAPGEPAGPRPKPGWAGPNPPVPGAPADPRPKPGGTYGLRPPLAAQPHRPPAPAAPAMPHPAPAKAPPAAAWPPARRPAPPPAGPADPAGPIEPLDVPAPEAAPPWGARGPGDDPTVDLQPIRQELLEIRGAMEALREQDGRSSAVLAELDQMKGMLSRLQRHGLPALPHQLPPALLRLYGDLAANDVDPMVAVRLCEYTQKALSEQGGEENMDHDKARLYMRRVVSDFIPVAPPMQPGPSGALVAALVGPAGAGKTASAAKLAALARQSLQRDVALVSLDVFRAGGADLLQRHASDLQAPVHVCITAEDLRAALSYYRDRALVLIDTPGLRDAAEIERLAKLLDEARPTETHLVLSATSKPRDLAEMARRFERLGPGRLLFTKLDETCTYGPILSTLARVRKPLSYLGVGPGVPQDLELATSRRVADLILPPAQAQP